MSPLSALKTSLGNFGGISFGGLGSSLLERPVIPSLLPQSGEGPSSTPMAPPAYASPSSEKPPGPLSLTTSDAEESTPLSLPPNKRIRASLKEAEQNGCSFAPPPAPPSQCTSPTDKPITNTAPTENPMETVPKVLLWIPS